jgi:hypothetical protein
MPSSNSGGTTPYLRETVRNIDDPNLGPEDVLEIEAAKWRASLISTLVRAAGTAIWAGCRNADGSINEDELNSFFNSFLGITSW